MPVSMLMQEIVMEHPEFLALLELVQARRVVGIDEKEFFPADQDERQRLIDQGRAALQQRGALKSQQPSEVALTPAFEALARTVAYPAIAIVIIRHVTGLGPQLFLHYAAGGAIVEQTFPREMVHRLAVMSDLPTMIEREAFILSLEDKPTTGTAVEMSENDFQTLREMVQQQPRERAEMFLAQHGARSAEIEPLFQALAHPTFTGTVAVLRCEQETITDARNMLVVQDRDTAWRAVQKIPGVPFLSIAPTNASAVKYQLLQYFEELARSA